MIAVMLAWTSGLGNDQDGGVLYITQYSKIWDIFLIYGEYLIYVCIPYYFIGWICI